MKCMECGADLYEGIKKCPYCKTLTGNDEEGKFGNFDFKYTISSPQQLDAIRESVQQVSKSMGVRKKEKKRFFSVKIRRMNKTEEKTPSSQVSRHNETDAAEKAREMAKSASQRAAEFIPEGLARYTVRGLENQPAQQSASFIKEEQDSLNTYTRVQKIAEKSERRVSSKRRARRNRKKKTGFKFNINKDIFKTAGLAAAALVLAVGVISLIVSLSSKTADTVSSYTYIKDNSLYMIYKGKAAEISQQVLCDSYVRYAEETENAVPVERAAKNAGLTFESKDGKRTYFFDDYNPETKSGTLKLVKSGKTKKVIEISPAVHNSVVMSKDGTSLLYLQTADKNGDMGVLYYWNTKLDEPFKVASDIDHGTFGFAGEEEWVVFIQNLNRVEMQGDLYVKSLEKLKEEKVKIDSAVCKIYGTNPGGAAYIYAKDYDKTDKSFDIYAMNKKGRSIRLGERTKRDPLMQKTKDKLFVYGTTEDATSNLYQVDINSGKKEKIASGVSSILMLSKDEKTVIYDKVYTGKLADYYAYTKGNQPQMIAHNVVVDYNAVAGKPQMAVSQDTTKILYISEFEAFKGGGTLNLCVFKKGKVVSEEQISEDVYAVYRAKDGKFIVAKDYSTSRKIFDVYLLDGNELKLIKEEVSPEMFEVSAEGDNIFCISNFGVEGKFGTLEKINLKGEAETVTEGIFDFSLTAENDILIYKNLNTDDGSFDLDIRLDGRRKITSVDTVVGEIVGY